MKSTHIDVRKTHGRFNAFTGGLICFLFFAVLTFFVQSCDEPINSVEPDPTPSRGFYYLENSTDYSLLLRAMTVGEPSFPLPLLQDTVDATVTTNIYILEPAASRTFLPSHIFSRLLVSTEINGMDSTLYDVVNDADWELREMRGGPHYYLRIPR